MTEETIVKAILKGKYLQVFSLLKDSKYFFSQNAKEVFDVCLGKFIKSEAIDFVSVYVKCKHSKEYIKKIYENDIYDSDNITQLCLTIIEDYIKRTMLERFSSYTSLLNQGNDVFSILEDFSREKDYIVSEINDLKTFNFNEAKDNVIKDIYKQNKGEYEPYLLTHIEELDSVIVGLEDTSLTILAARPAMGKTAVAIQIAQNMAMIGNKKVAFFSLEMGSNQIIKRLLSNYTETDSYRIKNAFYKNQIEFDTFATKAESLKTENIIIIDNLFSIDKIETKALELKNKLGIDIVIIDYLQLINTKVGENQTAKVSDISRRLKQLAMSLKVPVLALSQLSRSVETRGGDKKPMLSDLRDSGSIEQDANSVFFLYRPEYYGIPDDDMGITTNRLDIIIAKNRDGESNKTVSLTVNLAINKVMSRVSDFFIKKLSNVDF